MGHLSQTSPVFHPQSQVRLVAPLDGLDYYDCQSVTLPRTVSPLEAWRIIMADPLPGLALAFALRDGISARFGVKRIGGFSGQAPAQVAAGDQLDFFVVEHADETEMALTERDRHLDVMTSIRAEGARLSVTSSVRVHNRFGRAYMLPVGVAHRWIVRAMLRRLARSVAAERS